MILPGEAEEFAKAAGLYNPKAWSKKLNKAIVSLRPQDREWIKQKAGEVFMAKLEGHDVEAWDIVRFLEIIEHLLEEKCSSGL